MPVAEENRTCLCSTWLNCRFTDCSLDGEPIPDGTFNARLVNPRCPLHKHDGNAFTLTPRTESRP